MFYSADYMVGCMDVDVNDNVKPTSLIKFIQDTANRQMHDRKPSYVELFAEKKAFIVSRFSIEIYKELHQFDEINVRTWTAGERGVTFYRGYQVMLGDECAALASADWAVVDTADGHLYRTNEVDLSNYESGEKPDLDIATRFMLPKDMQFEKCGDHHIDYSECDMNMHMNNSQYADVMWNTIDDIRNSKVTSYSIRFRTEAACGSDIEIYKGKAENSLLHDDRAEDVYAFRTLVDGKTNVEALFGIKHLAR